MTFRQIERKKEREGKSYPVYEGIRICLATNKKIGNSKQNSEAKAGKEETKKTSSWQRREKETEPVIWTEMDWQRKTNPLCQ